MEYALRRNVKDVENRVVIHLDREPKKKDFICINNEVYRVQSVQGQTIYAQQLSGIKNNVHIA